MSDFFHGWRRKAGCVALVMAAAFTGGWIRSISIADFVSFSARNKSTDLFISAEGELTWQRTHDEASFPCFPSWSSSRLSNDITVDDTDALIWRWRLWGFEAGEAPPSVTGDGSRVEFCSLPYWSITIPLTFLSAYLILGRGIRKMSTNPPSVI